MHVTGRKPEQARKWLRKAAEEPSGVALASDATAKDLFDGADFDESEPDRELAQVCLECVCVWQRRTCWAALSRSASWHLV
jgi:hypothetical protein